MNKTSLIQLSICLFLFTTLWSTSFCKYKTYEDLEEIIKRANQTGVKDFEEEIEKGELTKPVSTKP